MTMKMEWIAAHDIGAFKKMYKLGPELGRAGFGTVYTGFRLKDGAAVAVKFVARANVTEWGMVRPVFLSLTLHCISPKPFLFYWRPLETGHGLRVKTALTFYYLGA